MRITFLSAFIAAFLVDAAAYTAKASSDGADNELAKFAALIKDADTMLRISADPAQRAIVCRLGFQRFSIGAIARATGLSKSRLMEAARGLMSMGLVSVADVGGEYICWSPRARAPAKNSAAGPTAGARTAGSAKPRADTTAHAPESHGRKIKVNPKGKDYPGDTRLRLVSVVAAALPERRNCQPRPKFGEDIESEAVSTLIRPWRPSKSRHLPCADAFANLNVPAPFPNRSGFCKRLSRLNFKDRCHAYWVLRSLHRLGRYCCGNVLLARRGCSRR